MKKIVKKAVKKATELARFRADPARVRVSVRRYGSPTSAFIEYIVTVTERSSGRSVCGIHPVPRSALLRVLLAAIHAGIDGVDMNLSRTYPHPHRKSGSFERSESLH